VLHEYGHALLHTIYGDGYLRRVPQWFDEGVSDFVARDHYKELFETSAAQIKKTLATSAAPSSEDLSRRLYERDPALRYAMARYMVDEILKGRKPEVIREILKQARPEGDFERRSSTRPAPRPPSSVTASLRASADRPETYFGVCACRRNSSTWRRCGQLGGAISRARVKS
jgi:hypothetical protein